MSEPHRVVFDCNILLQALASPHGPAGRCVQLAFDGSVNLYVSPLGLAELRDVSGRPKVVAGLRLIPARVDEYLVAIESAAAILDGFPETFAYERDPDDAHYVNLALAAGAKFIVSRDNDLLELMVPGKKEAKAFKASFPSLRILNPVEFLREIEPSTDDA